MTGATVVIPNWNGREHLAECLSTLLGSDVMRRASEIIVVDNGSIDGSPDLVRHKFPEVRLLSNASNRGFAAACNDGARASLSPYVAFLNNDARVDDGWLDPLIDTLDAEADVAAVGSLVLSWDGAAIDFARAGLTPLARGIQLDHGKPRARAPTEPCEQLFSNGAAMLVRRDAFLEVGGFDERFFAYYEDVDLGWRFWLLGWRVLLQPASVVFHRHHGTSGRFRPEQMEFLLTRNALASAVKNTDNTTFPLLIPILLLGESARLSGNAAAIESHYVPGFGHFAFRQRPREPALTRVRHRVGAEMVGMVRRDPAVRRRLAGWVSTLIDRRGSFVDGRAAAVVAALNEVLWGWPELMASRARIQTDRRREDREISALFGLNEQRRVPRSSALRPDEARDAVFRALEGVGLDWLIPRG